MLGDMQTVFLISHNNRTGMFDYRAYDPVPSARPLHVLKLFQQIVDGLRVDKARALEEVQADYSTTTEIADALMQRANVPFRIGHHFASKLTDYGRGRNLRIHEIPYAEAARLYEDETKEPFPLSESDFAVAISAEYMVFSRKGIGGPQPAEVDRMLDAERDKLASELGWLKTRHEALARADALLDERFAALARAGG
jgi:argininosuccinate lyase